MLTSVKRSRILLLIKVDTMELRKDANYFFSSLEEERVKQCKTE